MHVLSFAVALAEHNRSDHKVLTLKLKQHPTVGTVIFGEVLNSKVLLRRRDQHDIEASWLSPLGLMPFALRNKAFWVGVCVGRHSRLVGICDTLHAANLRTCLGLIGNNLQGSF